MHYTVHNASMMFVYGEQMLWQWVGTTPILVDAFFTIRLAYAFQSLLLIFELVINMDSIFGVFHSWFQWPAPFIQFPPQRSQTE